ncbi:hypothetical protein KM043_005487 [Ampulex compressa]|nr:hypothetical protein KM043_005487 [Ampulex compressa]
MWLFIRPTISVQLQKSGEQGVGIKRASKQCTWSEEMIMEARGRKKSPVWRGLTLTSRIEAHQRSFFEILEELLETPKIPKEIINPAYQAPDHDGPILLLTFRRTVLQPKTSVLQHKTDSSASRISNHEDQGAKTARECAGF